MPNTPDKWQTVARVTNPERKVMWEGVFGKAEVPIVSLVGERVSLLGFDEPKDVYMLDLKAITTEQRQRLVEAIAQRFGLPHGFVEDKLDEHGVPILADDVLVSSNDQGMIRSLID